MDKIWIVQGETGQAEDRVAWLFGWFETEEAAKQCLQFLIKTMKDAEDAYYNQGSIEDADKMPAYSFKQEIETFMREFDPQFRMDYNGTKYDYFSLSKGIDFEYIKLTDEKLKMLRNLARHELQK